MSVLIVLRPEGGRDTHDLPEHTARRLELMQSAVGGLMELLSPALHGLAHCT